MNTVTRKLSHHRHWRCLSTPAMTSKQLANPFMTMTRQFLPLCHENCLYVLALRGNCKHDGCSVVLHHLFHSHSSQCVEYKVKTGNCDNRECFYLSFEQKFVNRLYSNACGTEGEAEARNAAESRGILIFISAVHLCFLEFLSISNVLHIIFAEMKE